MKWLAGLCLVLILVFPLIATAGGLLMQMDDGDEEAAAPAACETQAPPTDTETYNTQYDIATAVDRDWKGTRFTASSNDTVCKICVYLESATGVDPGYDITAAHLYADDGGAPPVPTGSSLAEYNAGDTELSSAPVDGAWFCLTGGSYALVDTTVYWVVVEMGGTEATNKMRWVADSSCATESIARAGDGSSWTNSLDGSTCHGIQLYKE